MRRRRNGVQGDPAPSEPSTRGMEKAGTGGRRQIGINGDLDGKLAETATAARLCSWCGLREAVLFVVATWTCTVCAVSRHARVHAWLDKLRRTAEAA